MSSSYPTFALISAFPSLKNGEYETKERIKHASRSLGYECIVLDVNGNVLEKEDSACVDDIAFAISLHFYTPKLFDCFTYLALWNPYQFYFDWGYEQQAQHVLSYDDFLSCDSEVADDQVKRLIAFDRTRDWNPFAFHHSLSEPVIEPRREGDKTIFYCGINWERITKSKGRYHDLFKLLDAHDDIAFYGPEQFLESQPWQGFDHYQGELPFDGKSVVERIAECGIALVLSSDAHIESGLMSSRLYESCAAGAIVIADENAFAKKHFGDALLYIDSNQSADAVYQQVRRHVDWIERHPEEAFEKACRAQQIFLEHFDFKVTLKRIMEGHAARQSHLNELSLASVEKERVLAVQVMTDCEDATLDAFIAKVRGQRYSNIEWAVIVDADKELVLQERLQNEKHFPEVHLHAVEHCEAFFSGGRLKVPKRVSFGVGAVLAEILQNGSHDFFSVGYSHEAFFHDHISTLVRAFHRDEKADVAVADCLTKRAQVNMEGASGVEASHALLSLKSFEGLAPSRLEYYCSGRYLFRKDVFDPSMALWLKGMDVLHAHLMSFAAAKHGRVTGSGRVTVKCDGVLELPAESRKWHYEVQVLKDFIGAGMMAGGCRAGGEMPGDALTARVFDSFLRFYEGEVADKKVAGKTSALPSEPLPWSCRVANWGRALLGLFIKQKRVIIFGCGHAGIKALKSLSLKEQLLFFSDNDKAKHDNEFCGYPIKAPQAIESGQFDEVRIASMYYEEIQQQLVEMGVEGSKINVLSIFRK